MNLFHAVVAVSIVLAFPALAVEPQCGAPEWQAGTGVQSGVFNGKVIARCTFEASATGDFHRLASFLGREIEEQADKVYAGPTATKYSQMEAYYFDVEELEEAQGMKALVRSDVYLATDGSSRLLEDTFSKSITGEGQAKNLQKIDAGFFIQKGTGSQYTVTFSSALTVKKVAVVPAGQFEKFVKKALEKELKTIQQERISVFQSHL